VAYPHTNAPPDFQLPNDVIGGTAKQHRQAGMYALDFELLGRPRGFGVISGCQVTQKASGANMSVDVAPGYVDSEGLRLGQTTTTVNVSITTADATNPRIDVVVLTYAGSAAVRTGTAAAVPVPPALTMGDVVLAYVHLDAAQSSVVNTDITYRAINRDYDMSSEPTMRGQQEFFRGHTRELQRFFATLGGRLGRPANVLVVGDSLSEGYGVTDDTQKFMWQWREALQQDYRDGGVGFVPARHGTTWTYASNPDGLNAWTWTNLGDNNYYGFGLGDRCAFLTTAGASSGVISFYGTSFQLMFSTGVGSTGTAQIDVDAGTAFAQTFTFSTAGVGFSQSGRTYTSPALTQGFHSVKVTSITAASSVFCDGIMLFNTDETVGVHMWDSAHSGYLSNNFDPSVAATSQQWADYLFQPTNEVLFNAVITGHGTTTLDVTGGGFTNNDVDEYLHPPAGAAVSGSMSIPFGTKIVTVNSATQIVVNKTCANVGSLSAKMNRASFTNGVSTNASTTYTSASANFQPWDKLRKIKGTNIPAGTYIRRVNSTTSIELSQAATAGGSSLTFQINNRAAIPVQPDLVVIELGANDSKYGFSQSAWKTRINNIAQFILDRGIDYTPSIMLLSVWGAATTASYVDTSAQSANLSAIVTSSAADYGFYDSTGTLQTDLVGKSVTGTNIPGGATVLSVQTPSQLTLSANATGNCNGTLAITRIMQDFMWQRYRQFMRELAEENGWFLKDLYGLAGYIGNGQFATAQIPAAIATTTADPYGFTIDGTHPNNEGSRTIADQLSREIGGKAKTGTVSRGLGNGKGDTTVWYAADDPRNFPAQQSGQAKRYAPGATLGVRATDDNQKCRLIQQVTVVPAGTTVTAFGALTTLPTFTDSAAAANTDDEFCSRRSINTTAILNNASKVLSAFTLVRRGWMPEFTAVVKTGGTLTTVRYWIGLFSADPSGSASPAISLAAFRFDTGAPDTNWAVATKDGTTLNAKGTAIAITASTIYELAIVARGTAGSAPTSYDFYINDFPAGSLTANLPATGLVLGVGATVTALAAAARSIELSRYTLTSV
jgi:lysophospholipase L1-like esterase